MDDIVGFTHVVESVLDKVRNGNLAIDTDMVALLLSCGDHIGHMITALENDAELDADARADGEQLINQLVSDYLEKSSKPQTENSSPAADAAQAESADTGVSKDDDNIEVQPSADLLSNDNWHISLRFGKDVLRNGMDPLSFFRFLGTIGKIIAISSLTDKLPGMDIFDPESCYMGYEISYRSKASKTEIEEVFEFVEDDCDIYILPPHSRAKDFAEMIQKLPDDDTFIGEILVKCGSLTERELKKLLDQQNETEETTGEKPKLGEIAVEQGVVQPTVVNSALEKQKQVKDNKAKAQQLVRVDAEKLDMLVDLIGELVIAGASINVIAQKADLSEMQEATSVMNRLVEEVRDRALNLRMVQIGETFNRFHRVVRDVSKEMGKDIGLVITGGDTELDKMVVEKIADPLTHLVRNSIDHGIEQAEIRLERGKPDKGTVKLNAYHDSGSIVIEVADDGGGLNSEKILAKAKDKGLVSAEQTLSDKEIYQLIFEAGFSTADKISNISGRGVGMDVVKRNIEALRGTVEIDSTLGVGTTMSIRLPLTLAIIDGFLVNVGNSSFVVPLDMVVECVDLADEDKDALQERSYINLRGEVLPFVHLREMFKIAQPASRRQSVVVVQYGSMRAGLVVDNLLGEFQTVIKPLGRLFESMKGIGGSTILGNGEVALILDVPNLVHMVTLNVNNNKVAA